MNKILMVLVAIIMSTAVVAQSGGMRCAYAGPGVCLPSCKPSPDCPPNCCICPASACAHANNAVKTDALMSNNVENDPVVVSGSVATVSSAVAVSHAPMALTSCPMRPGCVCR